MDIVSKKAKDKKNLYHQKYISRITKTLYYGKFPNPGGLSLPVTELAAEIFSEAQRGRSLDRLHCDNAANISRKACVSPCSLVIAMLYLERLKKTCPEYLEKTASSDLFLVSLMVSCKFLYDDGEDDEVFISEWAMSAGITVKTLVQLERNFLKAIDWEVFVSELTFWRKLNELERILAKREGTSRGFFTYTELQSLLTTIDLQNLFQNILSLCTILIASYTVALLALFGSVLIVSHIPGASFQAKKFNIEQCNTTYDSFPNEANTAIPCGFHESEKIMPEIITETKFVEKFCITNDSLEQNNNVQNVSWDWWSIPILQWLSATSTLIEQSVEMSRLDFVNYQNIYTTYIRDNVLDLKLENKVSWRHTEWTDIITHDFYDTNNNLHYYMENVNS